MPASQFLSNPNGKPTSRAFDQFAFRIDEVSNAQTGSESLIAALAVVHLRFSSSQCFQFGRLHGSEFSICNLTVEPDCTIKDLTGLIDGLSFEVATSVAEECGVIFGESSSAPDDFLQKHSDDIEVFYQFDRAAQNVVIHFRSGLFDVRTVELWAGAFQRVLGQLIQSESDTSIGEMAVGKLEIVDDSVRQQVVANGHKQTPGTDEFYSNTPSTNFTFHKRFEQQVERAPDRVAVWARNHPDDTEGVELGYAELNRQANGVARFLIDACIKPEDSVGIVMQRRVNLLAVLIGVMKAGGRYVALESELPTDRLAFMANDSSVEYLITEESLSDRTEELVKEISRNRSITTLVCDSDQHATFCDSIDLNANPDAGIHSQQAAYTIYTSGSTGTPKGVEICHHALVNFCHIFVKQLEFTADDTSVAMSTIAFDASIGELFPLLLIGGRVAIGHKQVGANGKQLQRLISDVDGTYMAATPTSLRVLVASGWEGSPNLTVIPGGEALTPLVRDEVMPRVKRLINGYGPTECTVYSTFGFLQNDVDAIPLGGPILNARLYVLDDFGKPVPPMVRGNLFIGCLLYTSPSPRD